MPRTLGRGRALIALACTIIAFAAVATPASAAGAQTWSITPQSGNRTITATDDGWRLAGDSARHRSAGSTQRVGTLVVATKRFSHDVNAVRADVDASIPDGSAAAVDVRGLRADGTWTEWTEVRPERAAVLAEATRTVQARLVLTAPSAAASPQVREIDLSASTSSAAPTDGVQALGAGLTYRIYATREGLVGGTTANGHVIVSRDHFVALPSRRGLAGNNSGNYSVRVCKTDNSRCEWAPVWDVGPWNTKDDYWNPASVREMWQDLPQGKPEAQAAYQDGYNGGRDQFGRRVLNPAGIDLADGTFWDGLKLADNAWVNVSYAWTGSGPWGTVAVSGPVLNVRAGTTSASTQVGLAAKYAQVRIECYATGETVTGSQGTTNRWFRLTAGKFVSAAYIKVGAAPGPC